MIFVISLLENKNYWSKQSGWLMIGLDFNNKSGKWINSYVDMLVHTESNTKSSTRKVLKWLKIVSLLHFLTSFGIKDFDTSKPFYSCYK